MVSVGVGSGSGSGALSVGTGMGSGLADAEPVDPTTTAADSTAAMPARARGARMISPFACPADWQTSGGPFGHAPAAPRAAVAGIGAPLRKGAGSSGAPSMRTSKCRCGPVAKPVDPTTPIGWPLRTRAPGSHREGGLVGVEGGQVQPADRPVVDDGHVPVRRVELGQEHHAAVCGVDDPVATAEVHPGVDLDVVQDRMKPRPVGRGERTGARSDEAARALGRPRQGRQPRRHRADAFSELPGLRRQRLVARLVVGLRQQRRVQRRTVHEHRGVQLCLGERRLLLLRGHALDGGGCRSALALLQHPSRGQPGLQGGEVGAVLVQVGDHRVAGVGDALHVAEPVDELFRRLRGEDQRPRAERSVALVGRAGEVAQVGAVTSDAAPGRWRARGPRAPRPARLRAARGAPGARPAGRRRARRGSWRAPPAPRRGRSRPRPARPRRPAWRDRRGCPRPAGLPSGPTGP